MAEDETGGSPMKLLWMVVGFMAVLIFLWFETADIKTLI